HELAHLVIGSDPLRSEDTWQVLTRGGFYRGGPVTSTAVAGYVQALLDIAGRVNGAPVHQLLGGAVRERVRVHGWVAGDRPDDIAEQIARRREQGLDAVKCNASAELGAIDAAAAVAGVVERATIARPALGSDGDFALDSMAGSARRWPGASCPRSSRSFHSSSRSRWHPSWPPNTCPHHGKHVRPDRLRGACVLATGRRPAPRGRHRRCSAGRIPRRWDLRDASHRVVGRDARGEHRPALPARPDRSHRKPAGGSGGTQRADPGAEPRHPPQRELGRARPRPRHCRLRHL
ncbi:MAG: hypothetical protein JJE50_07440, partial [Actinomycetales bacterium]|nr:hypothetical protein [Actinomycetales bacterium]